MYVQVRQGLPLVFRVSARRPATGRIEASAQATVRVVDSADLPVVELPLVWDPNLLRYTGRSTTEDWALGRHTAVAEVRDSVSRELLGGFSSVIDVLPPISLWRRGAPSG